MCVSRKKLGPGVFVISTATGSRSVDREYDKVAGEPSAGAPGYLKDTGVETLAQQQQPPVIPASQPQAHEALAKDKSVKVVPETEEAVAAGDSSRLLRVTHSDEAVFDVSVAEQAAHKVKAAADAGKWLSRDACDADSVHSCFKSFLEDYLKTEASRHRTEQETMDGFCALWSRAWKGTTPLSICQPSRRS